MGLREDIRTEPVESLPLRKAVTVDPTTAVRRVVACMKEAQLGCVFVVDDRQRPVGKFTERLLIRLLVHDTSMLDDPIEKHMIPVGRCVKLDDRIADVIDEMQQTGVRFVCVVDRDGKVVSLAGQRSVMEYLADHFPRQVKVQMMESKLYMDQREGA